jgi:hypothetical protein
MFLDEIIVHAGNEVLMKDDDNILLIACVLKGILGQLLRSPI